jgi:phage terminase large subunit-like protein
MLTVNRSTKRIICWETNSVFRALSADAFTKEGLNISGLIFDELHAQKNRSLWDTLAYGGASRRQPLRVSITTAGFDRDTICWEQHEYAGKVLDGSIDDPSFFAYVSAAGPEDNWKSLGVWKKANPSFGITIKADQFEEDCRKAQDSPAKENSFRRYRLNQWTEQETRLISMDAWNRCNAAVDPDDIRRKPCIAGLDLGVNRDLTALLLVFTVGDKHLWLPRFWMPEDNVGERQRKDGVDYARWVHDGLITTTPGNRTDYNFIRKAINDLGSEYLIQEIAFDPYNATQLCNDLMDDGFQMVEFRQGFLSMSPATKATLELISAQRIAHGGHPILKWMAANVAAKQDPAGNIKPVKPDPKSGKRIDGIVAGIMAEGRLIQNPDRGNSYDP